MPRIAIVLAAALLLVSCAATVRGPSVEISGPKIKVEDEEHGRSGGKFCPPGQAKKNNC